MFSLIVATVNRVTELERLLASLDLQSCKQFEVIVVDQNGDDRLAPVLRAHPGLTTRHLRCERGISRARNVGLRVASGEYIAFPDDDCWYPPGLLASVSEWLNSRPDVDGLFGIMRDADGTPVGPRWAPTECAVSRSNLWSTTVSVNAFLRRRVTDAVGLFREDIGVGAATPYQSGEESDYFLRALAKDFRFWYEPSFVVHHPNLHNIDRLRRTSYSYSLGAGFTLRIHGYSWWDLGDRLIRSIGGAAVSLAKGNIPMAGIYTRRAAGQLRGYLLGSSDLRRSTGMDS